MARPRAFEPDPDQCSQQRDADTDWQKAPQPIRSIHGEIQDQAGQLQRNGDERAEGSVGNVIAAILLIVGRQYFWVGHDRFRASRKILQPVASARTMQSSAGACSGASVASCLPSR